ncbi:MAG: hypothetical protein ACQES0_00390 [Bacteroidota bacterium]
MKHWVILVFALLSTTLAAQSPLGKRQLTGLESERQTVENSLSLVYHNQPQNISDSLQTGSGFLNWLLNKPALQSTGENHHIVLNPAFNFQAGTYQNGNTWINTRGAEIHGNFSQKIRFHTSFFENQGRFPAYLNEYATNYGVLPGYARMKPYNESDWDYASAYGSIEIQPADFLNIRFGHDKPFIGEGHRSLFLSDATFQSLFLQTSLEFGNWRYTNLSMQWMNPNFNNPMGWENTQSIEGNYQRKFSSYNMLEYRFSDNFRLGFIEAVLFDVIDQHSYFNPHMLNPLPGIRATMLGTGSKDNIITGLDALLKRKNSHYYLQFLIDNLQMSSLTYKNPYNRFAWQIGAVFFDIMGIKNLHARAEHNYIRANTWASATPEVGWSHYNQPVAHPAGSNLAEFTGELQYRYKRFPMRTKISYMRRGKEQNEVLMPAEYPTDGAFIAGPAEKFLYADTEMAFIINPAWHWLAFAGVTYRHSEDNLLWIRFGTRTNLNRLIRDF